MRTSLRVQRAIHNNHKPGEFRRKKSKIASTEPNRADWRAKGQYGPRRMAPLPTWASHRSGSTWVGTSTVRASSTPRRTPLPLSKGRRLARYLIQGKTLTARQLRRIKHKARKNGE